MTTYPIADPLRGKTVPDDGAFATDTQVMTGADPRAGRRGGVNRAASSTMTGTLAAQSGDYTAGIEVHNLPSSLTDILVGSGSGATVTVRASKTQVQIDAAGGGASSVITLASADRANFAIVRTGLRALTLYRDGVSVATLTSSADTSTSLPMPTATTAYAHDVKGHWYFNRALTADEIKACNKGEIPAELARQGFVPIATSAYSVVNGTGVASGTSTTGFTVSGVSGFADLRAPTDRRYFKGQRVRVTLTSTGSGYVYEGDGSLGVAAFGPGTTTVEFISPSDSQDIIIRCIGDQTVSAVGEVVIGTVEHFAADQVTSTGRWIGKFGTSLIPGSGITPLNPQPVQRRHMSFSFDLTVPSFTGVPSGWTVSTGGTGNISITRPSYAHTNPSTACNRTNNGFAASTQNPANSFVDLSNTSGTATNTSGTVDQSWDE